MCVCEGCVCVGGCVCGGGGGGKEEGAVCIHVCGGGLVKGQLAGERGTKESNASKKFVVKFFILE